MRRTSATTNWASGLPCLQASNGSGSEAGEGEAELSIRLGAHIAGGFRKEEKGFFEAFVNVVYYRIFLQEGELPGFSQEARSFRTTGHLERRVLSAQRSRRLHGKLDKSGGFLIA